MTKYAISKIHLEGIYEEIVELFPSFQKNYKNLEEIECVSKELGIQSIRFVQDLAYEDGWRDLFNEDYLVDTIIGVREIRHIYPYGYTCIDKLIKRLVSDEIDNMIIVGKLASCCIVEATELFLPHMNVSVVKDAIFDERAYYSSACRRLKPFSITTQELIGKLGQNLERG